MRVCLTQIMYRPCDLACAVSVKLLINIQSDLRTDCCFFKQDAMSTAASVRQATGERDALQV